jgi:DNA-directed RNA polymerase alpha subunit
MQGDLIDIANGAPLPDVRAVIQKLAFAIVELQVAQNSIDKEREEKIRNFRGDASLAAVLADHSVAALKKAGIITLKQASAMTDEELLAIPNVGKKTVKEIRGL